MSLAEFFKMLPDYVVTSSQLAYARYLEQRGKRLCIDFGFENAEDLAWHELERDYQMHLRTPKLQ